MKTKKTIVLLITLACVGICFGVAVTSSPWDGTGWNTGAPNDEALVGNTYKEIQDLRKGVGIRLDKEHVALASSSAGGEHQQGSARAFFQDAAPTTQLDGDAWVAGDTGSLWFDTNASPDNLVYVLTNHASTGTWTLLSVSMTAEIVAAAHSWADVQTFDLQTVHTLGILSNADITLGAGDDLVGSATSDILINTNKFTVAGATGDTLVAGTLDVTGIATLGDGSLGTTQSASDASTKFATTAYVDTQTDTDIATATAFSAYTTDDDTPTAMLKDHAYLATSDGFVVARASMNNTQVLKGYVDTDTDPVTGGLLVGAVYASQTNEVHTTSFPVANGEYFEITSTATMQAIYWKSVGTLSKPTDQD